MSKENFNFLLMKLDWEESTQLNRKVNFELTYINRLLLTLLWLRQYPSLKLLAWIFRIDPSTVSRTLLNVLDKLWRFLEPKLEIPSTVTERMLTGKRIGMFFVIMVIDGAEQQVLESIHKYKKNITFSGKKHIHTFTKLIGVSPNGMVYLKITTW